MWSPERGILGSLHLSVWSPERGIIGSQHLSVWSPERGIIGSLHLSMWSPKRGIIGSLIGVEPSNYSVIHFLYRIWHFKMEFSRTFHVYILE